MASNISSWKPQSPLFHADDLPVTVANHRIVIIHCGAAWDKHDALFDADIQKIKGQFADNIGFYALDIDEENNREFCDQHEILTVPALVCYVDGLWQGTSIGRLTEDKLVAYFLHWRTIAQAGDVKAKESVTWGISASRPQQYAYSQKWRRFPFLRHGVTLRTGDTGESNLSFSVTRDWDEVRHNRDRACRALHFTPQQLIVPSQTHGANVAVVSAEDAGRGALSPDTAISDCDALVTNTPALLLGITVADCLPVFFLDPVRKVVGIAHSGWRGTAGRIGVHTLAAMSEHFGTLPADCLIAIGPGIGPDGYEVDQRVYDGFQPDDAQAPGVFTPTRPGHWQLDLYAAVVHQLQQAGVPPSNFDLCQYRTHRDTDLFFSHRLVPGCGRMGAFIGLPEAVL